MILSKPIIVMDHDAYHAEKRAEFDNAMSKGIKRGYLNLVYYLTEIKEGKLESIDIDVDGFNEKEINQIKALVQCLHPARLGDRKLPDQWWCTHCDFPFYADIGADKCFCPNCGGDVNLIIHQGNTDVSK